MTDRFFDHWNKHKNIEILQVSLNAFVVNASFSGTIFVWSIFFHFSTLLTAFGLRRRKPTKWKRYVLIMWTFHNINANIHLVSRNLFPNFEHILRNVIATIKFGRATITGLLQLLWICSNIKKIVPWILLIQYAIPSFELVTR